MLSRLEKPIRNKRKRDNEISNLRARVGAPTSIETAGDAPGYSYGGSSSSSLSAAQLQPEHLKEVVSDLFLTNKLCGVDTHRLAAGGLTAGATGVSKLAAAGGQGKHPKNFCRDILRELLHGTPAPPMFWFPAATWDPDTEQKSNNAIHAGSPSLVYVS